MRIQHNIDNVFQMIEGHRKCLDNNTGITNTPTQNKLVNPDGLIAAGWAGNKINNDWAMHESQAVLILGYIEAYRASKSDFYLGRAKDAWEAYNSHLLGAYAVESKMQRLSHYPPYPQMGFHHMVGLKMWWCLLPTVEEKSQLDLRHGENTLTRHSKRITVC